MANQANFDSEILAATGKGTIELAYQSLEENYNSNNKDFSADVRNALIGAGLSNEDIGQILYQIENHDDGGGGGDSDVLIVRLLLL